MSGQCCADILAFTCRAICLEYSLFIKLMSPTQGLGRVMENWKSHDTDIYCLRSEKT